MMLIFQTCSINLKHLIGYKILESHDKSKYWVSAYTTGGSYVGETKLYVFDNYDEAFEYKKLLDLKLLGLKNKTNKTMAYKMY